MPIVLGTINSFNLLPPLPLFFVNHLKKKLVKLKLVSRNRVGNSTYKKLIIKLKN